MSTPNPLAGIRTPITYGFIASLVLVAAAMTVTRHYGLQNLALWTGSSVKPWKFFTYPWSFSPMTSGLTLLIFVCVMVWFVQVGTWVENELGSLKFLGYLATVTAIGGLSVWIIALASRSSFLVAGPLIPISATSIAWCTRNRSQKIMLYGALPMSAAFVGWAFVAMVVFSYLQPNPALGFGACIPLALSYFFASDKLPKLSFVQGARMVPGRRFVNPKQKESVSRGQIMYDQEYFDDVKRREIERAERERLKKLLGED